MAIFKPLPIKVEPATDEKQLTSVPDLAGVMAYGNAANEAIGRVKAISLQILADMIERGQEVPVPVWVLFSAGLPLQDR